MDLYINGEGCETNKKRAAQSFIDAAKDNMENIKIRALIKDAMFYRYIASKGNGWIETLDGGIKLGKKPSEVLEFLKNPENEEVMMNLMNKVEQYWKA
jgi:TPR repeat protein